MKQAVLAVGGLAVFSGSAFAHPEGHAMPVMQSLFHLLTEPDHLALLVGGLALAAGIAYRMMRRA